ncbi:hypothetical protein NHQ30_008630 [Ciborinia camelliae]|nr:hypothetical protein NHQ30_008630 [Ciborinia camelliae]
MMSLENITIYQHKNSGTTTGVHVGDNNYSNCQVKTTSLEEFASNDYKKAKAKWKSSNTCDWLLQEENFKYWEKTNKACSFLWLHGRQVNSLLIRSRVIENVYANRCAAEGPEVIHLLYCFIGYGIDQKEDRLYRDMLLTFLGQATEKSKRQSTNIKSDSPPESIEQELLKCLASSKRDIYIIIDALDHLLERSRFVLINALKSLDQKLKDEKSGCRLRVAISSRDCTGMEQLLGYEIFPIEVTTIKNERDIKTYLEKNLKSALFDENPEFRKIVLKELNKKADGM